MDRPDIMTTVDTHAPRLLDLPGVAGVAVGALPSGAPCVRVYVARLTAALQAALPRELDGWPVDVEESGPARPLSGR